MIEAVDLSTMGGICWKPKRLTYAGHQFLDAARSDTVWQKAKSLVAKSTGTLTLEGLKLESGIGRRGMSDRRALWSFVWAFRG